MLAVVRPWRKGDTSRPWREISRRFLRFAKPEGGGGAEGSGEGLEEERDGEVAAVERKRRARQREQIARDGFRAYISYGEAPLISPGYIYLVTKPTVDYSKLTNDVSK